MFDLVKLCLNSDGTVLESGSGSACCQTVVMGLSLGKRKTFRFTSCPVCCHVVAMIADFLSGAGFGFPAELEAMGICRGTLLGILLKAVGIGLVCEIAGFWSAVTQKTDSGKSAANAGLGGNSVPFSSIFPPMLELHTGELRDHAVRVIVQ